MRKLTFIILNLFLLVSCGKQSKESSINQTSMNQEENNPILQKWETPFGTPPFDKIKSEDYLPAFKTAIKQHWEEIEQISNRTASPTFENTILALELSGKNLKKVQNVFFAVESAHTNDVLKQTSKQIRPELAAHADRIRMNKKLFDRVNTIYQQKEKLHLDDEDKKLLEETYKTFVRAGVNLPEQKQKRLQEINKELASLSQQFNENLLEETNRFELYIIDKSDLGEMPEQAVKAAEKEAKKRGRQTGWSFTLQRPSMYPFLDYSPNRELREKIFQAYANRGNNNNEHDNKKIIERLAQLRAEKAQILGYVNYAQYILEENMAEKPENVYEFLDKIWTPALKMAKKERDDLAKAMKADGINDKFRASDWRYYVRKIRNEKYQFDENTTKPYFEVNAVRDGAFLLANKLFGLNFKERKDIAVWHKDQQVFEVTDSSGKHVGVIYMDFFARPSKRGGAWMNALRKQSNTNGEFVTPIVTNNFNFPSPTGNTPVLLDFTQAQTVFHEFGHALHGLLSDVKYASLSGTSVPRDFVEFPSQVMENWMSHPDMLKLYAKHFQQGTVIPTSLIEKMNKANSFNEGFRSVEYLAAAYLDMDWHTVNDTLLRKTLDVEKQTTQKIGLIDEIIPRYRSTYYAHIFGGGYAAGYYSYLWSEVLDADTFAAFEATGNIFNPELASKYKKLISSGGTKSGMKLYEEFLRRKPKVTPLLKKKGFIQ